MKKTVAAIAILASTAASQAMPLPPDPNAPKPKTICLNMYQNQDGSTSLGNCDVSRNNIILKARLGQNGCAAEQAAITTRNKIAIAACMPPGVVQL
jgi:hypothetical protein